MKHMRPARQLPSSPFELAGYAPTTRGRMDHPRLHCGLFYENAFFHPVRPDCVTSDAKGLMPVMGHVAGLQGRIVDQIVVLLRKVRQKVDCVFDARYFSHEILSLLQIDRAIKHRRDHSYLTENVDVQRTNRAPIDDLFSLSSGFKILRKEALKNFCWRGCMTLHLTREQAQALLSQRKKRKFEVVKNG